VVVAVVAMTSRAPDRCGEDYVPFSPKDW
jgi:hypothetical protein